MLIHFKIFFPFQKVQIICLPRDTGPNLKTYIVGSCRHGTQSLIQTHKSVNE